MTQADCPTAATLWNTTTTVVTRRRVSIVIPFRDVIATSWTRITIITKIGVWPKLDFRVRPRLLLPFHVENWQSVNREEDFANAGMNILPMMTGRVAVQRVGSLDLQQLCLRVSSLHHILCCENSPIVLRRRLFT